MVNIWNSVKYCEAFSFRGEVIGTAAFLSSKERKFIVTPTVLWYSVIIINHIYKDSFAVNQQ